MGFHKIMFAAALLAPASLAIGAAALSVENPCAMRIQNQGGFLVGFCQKDDGCPPDPDPPSNPPAPIDCKEKQGVNNDFVCRCNGTDIDTDRRCASSWYKDGAGHVTSWICSRVEPCLLLDCQQETVPAPVEPEENGAIVYACKCVTSGVGGH